MLTELMFDPFRHKTHSVDEIQGSNISTNAIPYNEYDELVDESFCLREHHFSLRYITLSNSRSKTIPPLSQPNTIVCLR